MSIASHPVTNQLLCLDSSGQVHSLTVAITGVCVCVYVCVCMYMCVCVCICVCGIEVVTNMTSICREVAPLSIQGSRFNVQVWIAVVKFTQS